MPLTWEIKHTTEQIDHSDPISGVIDLVDERVEDSWDVDIGEVAPTGARRLFRLGLALSRTRHAMVLLR